MRVFTVLGPSHSGKTTLVQALAELDNDKGGRMQACGGTSAVQMFRYLKDDWAVFDIPGGADYMAQAGPALAASDTAVLCVPPEADMAVLAAPYLRLIEEADIPCIVFINRLDNASERVRDIIAALQGYSSHHIVLRQVPMRQGEEIIGAVDLISERAWRYQEGEPSALVEMPFDVAPREEQARAELLESLADFDDALLEQLIEDKQPLTGDVFHTATEALQHNRLIPCFLGSAVNGNGVTRLMKSLRHEAPGHDVTQTRLGSSIQAVSCLGESARHLGKVVLLRAFDDSLSSGAALAGGTIGSLTEIDAKTPRPALGAGQIALAVKTDHINAGSALTGRSAAPLPEWAAPRAPSLRRIVRLTHERDEARLSTALNRLSEIDPGLSIEQDQRTGETVLGFQGPQHARLISHRLVEDFGIETNLAQVTPPYRETIRGRAEWHHRHRKQSGGAGQFADVVIAVRALARGEGVAFTEEVKGGAVPRKFIPAVEAGVREALEHGPGGYPVVDIGVTLLDGKHHAVDSSEFAFRTAARNAIREVLADMGTQALQPIDKVQIHVPSVFAGGLVPVISALKGQVLGFEGHPTAAGWDVFSALLPASSENGLGRTLGSLTRGTAWFEARFDHFEPCRREDLVTEDAEETAAHA